MVKTLTLLFCLFSKEREIFAHLRKAYRRSDLSHLTSLTQFPFLGGELALFGCVQRWAQSLSPKGYRFLFGLLVGKESWVFYKRAILAGLVSVLKILWEVTAFLASFFFKKCLFLFI